MPCAGYPTQQAHRENITIWDLMGIDEMTFGMLHLVEFYILLPVADFKRRCPGVSFSEGLGNLCGQRLANLARQRVVPWEESPQHIAARSTDSRQLLCDCLWSHIKWPAMCWSLSLKTS